MAHPYIDIYTLTYQRNKETIENFLSKFTDRQAIEDQKDGELMLLPNGKSRKEVNGLDDYIWVKALTVTNSIEVGLSDPTNCFTMYLAANRPDIDLAILTFTQDGKLILGLSVYEYKDENSTVDNYDLATQLRDEIQKDYSGIASYFGLEASPPDNEREFLKDMEIWEAK